MFAAEETLSANPHGFGQPGMRHHYVGSLGIPRSSVYIAHVTSFAIAGAWKGMTATAVRGEDFSRLPIYKMRMLRRYWDQPTREFRVALAQVIRQLKKQNGRRCGRPLCAIVARQLLRYPPSYPERVVGHIDEWNPAKLIRTVTKDTTELL